MSHHLYDPFAADNQSATQGQYGLSGMQERDPRRLPSRLGPEPSFSSSGAASATPTNSGGMVPPLAQSVSYRTEQSRTRVDEDLERSVDMHISRAREEARFLGHPDHPLSGHGTRFTSSQREEYQSSDTRTTSYPISSTSASQGHRHSDVGRSRSSMDWLSSFKRPTVDDSAKCYASPVSSTYTSSGDGRFSTPTERECDVQSIPGLGGYDYTATDKSDESSDTSQPKYTSQTATDILSRFGLEKEDLEYLISYPEDQLTPTNLPFILRQIRVEKAKKSMTPVQSSSYPDPQPVRSSSGSSAVLQPPKVIDYGHTGKYVSGVLDDIGRTSGRSASSGGSDSMLLDTCEQRPSSSGQEPPKKGIAEIKISTLVSSRDKSTSVNSLSSSYNTVAPTSTEPRVQTSSVTSLSSSTQPNQTSLPGFHPFALPKKDTDRRVFTSESKPLPFKEPEAETRPKLPLPFPTLSSGNPGRCGLVLIDKTFNSGTKDASKTQGHESTVPKQMTKEQRQKIEQKQEQKQKQEKQKQEKQKQEQKRKLEEKQKQEQKRKQEEKQKQEQKRKQEQKQKQEEKRKLEEKRKQEEKWKQEQKHKSETIKIEQTQKPVQPFWTAVYPPVPIIPSATVQYSSPVFLSGGARPPGFPPASLQQNTTPWKYFDFLKQHLVKVPGVQDRPTPAMMHDYAAASPKVFPHTCSLCFTECRNIQDWISHQNTNLHLESCRYLRTLYSQWNGEIVLESSAAGKDAKSSTSAKNSQKSQRKSSHGSRSHSRSRSRSWSRSPSSRRRRRSEGRRANRSRSRSCSSRYSRSRSRSPYYDHRRSRSRSHERRRRSSERRSSEERRSSLRRTRDIRSSPRSRDRRSSPRSEERWSSSGRSEERRSSPKRSRERRLSPRRRDDRWSSPRSDDKRSSPKRSNERRSSTERSPQLKRSSSAEKLVKKLLEKTAKQSLSKESDLEAVVKTLLAEITKKKPSSSSFSLSAKRTQPKSSTSAGAKSSASAASSSSLSSSSAPKKLAKASPQLSTMVKLEGIVSSHSHGDIVAAVERFGKTKSVVLFRQQAKAHVFFENCKDAHKLKSAKIIDVSGISLTAGTLSFTKKDRQKAALLKKRGKLSASKPQTTKSSKSAITALLSIPALLPTPGFRPSSGLLPTPGFPPSPGLLSTPGFPPSPGLLQTPGFPPSPGLLQTPGLRVPSRARKNPPTHQAKKITTGKCLKKKTVKGSVKGSTSVTKAKVLVFKAKNISKSPEHVSKRKKPVMQRKRSAAVNESANMTQIRVPETITELKVKVETASTSQEAETPVEKFILKEEVEEVTAEQKNVPATSTVSENPPDAETSKSQESIEIESNVQPSMVTPEGLVQVEMGKVAVSSAQVKHQAEPAKANVKVEDAQDAEPMEAEGKGAEVSEPMEVESCAEGNGEEQTNTEAAPEKADENRLPTSADETRADLSAVETPAVPPQNQGAAPEPQTDIETPETSVKASSQTSEPEASQPSSLAEGSEKTDSASLVEFQKDPESAEVSSKVTGGDPTVSPAVATSDKIAPETAAVSKQPAAATPSLTMGEKFEANFNKEKLGFLSMKSIMSPKFCQRPAKMMLITNLPKYNDGSYTEEDVANLLIPFGFVYDDENIYVATQACVAFFVMPSPQSVRYLMRFTSKKRLTLGNSELDISVTNCDFSMIPLQFYKFSMKRKKVTNSLPDDATRIVYVKNISPSEVKVLKEDLRKIDQVKNIFPLLNKVFVEFETSGDADRLGVWYSLLKDAPGYRIYRLEIPKSTTTAQLPRFPLKAIPHGNTAAVPSLKYGVPLNSVPPFWVTIPTRPFVFPTLSTWFIIPKFLTVRTKEDVSKANNQFFRTPTIMFTGLPQGHYKHEDVARLVWSYFPKQTLQSLYYRVSVLTLQRRAFVRFNDWVTCCKFVREHIAKPICVRGFRLKVHFIFENVLMESTEELMYRSLMKLSNSRVPDREALEERLLCVEISEASVNIVTVVLEVVASIAPFVSFLPLANRVQQRRKTAHTSMFLFWCFQICVEMVDASGVAEVVEKYRSFSPDSQIRRTTWEKVLCFENMKSLKQRLEDANDVTVILEPEAPAGGAPAREDTHKLGADTAVAESPAASKIGQDIITAIKAAVHQHKTSRGSRTNSEEKDVRDDFRSSDTYLSEVETFNMDDFVTVDEVGNDVQDTDPDRYRCSSSKRSHMAEREQQRSSYESARRMSTRSTRSSKNSSSSSSYKPREVSTKRSSASHSTSMSPKKAKRSPEPMKSQTKPSSSSSLRSPDSSSSSDPKTKSLVKATSASSSSCWIRPSSAAREREKESASTAEPNPPESQSAVSQSDHRVSAEDTAAKTVESETKTETLSEMHTPAQGQGSGLSQIQNLEIGFKDNKVAGLEEGKDDLQKDTKEDEDDDENYHVLDSFEEQPENQVDDDDPQPEPESFQDETFQVLDSIEDDGEPSPEKCSEKEPDGGVLVKDNSGSAVKQLSEVDVNRVSNKSEEKPASEDINNENRDKKDQNRSEEEEEASKEADKPDDQIPNDEDQLCEDKDDVKELDGKIANHEPFEILDLTEDQVAMEDHGQNLEPRSYQMSEDVIVLKEDGEEDETYQVVDSVEDQATTTTTESEADNKKKRTSKLETRSPRRSGRRTRATIDEEKEASPRKRDKALKEPETQTNKGTSAREDRETHEVNEVYEVIDSFEDEPVQGASISERSSRRRSARGKKGDLLETSKKPDGDTEAMYEILDSVEDDNVTEEQTVVTRSTRGRRERTTNKDAFIDLTDREDTPSRRRRTPARETPKKDVEPQEEGTPTKKSDVTVREVGEEEVTYEIVDSVEDEIVKDKRPTGRGRGRRGRPKKDMNMTKKGMGRQKKGDKEEEKVSYQVLDSVEDETVDDHHPPAEHSMSASGTGTSEIDEKLKEESAGLPKKDEEEEPVYQIVDSVEDDQVQEELMTNKTSDEISPKVEEPAVEEETTYSTSVLEASEDVVYGLEEISDASSAEDDFGFENTERTKVNSKEGSQQGTEMPAEEKNDMRNFLVNLDEVSDEEEDYPDDTAEEEQLRKARAAAEERRFAKEQESQQEKRRTREKEEGRRSRERARRSSSGGGGSSDERRRRVKESRRDKDVEGLVTLDEVGADEAGEEAAAAQNLEWGGEVTTGELQELVTLDEVLEDEEEEEAKAEERSQEEPSLNKVDESVDSLNIHKTLDEAGVHQEAKVEELQRTESVKRKHETDESVNFVTVDEVGGVEEEEEKEAPRTRGRPKKKTRKTPVRKSARGKKVATDEQGEDEKPGSDEPPPPPDPIQALSSPDKDLTTLQSEGRHKIQKTEEEGAGEAGADAPSAGQELQSENQSLEGSVEEEEKTPEGSVDIKAVSKRRRELVGPEAKRSRSQSPCVPIDVKLPAFNPDDSYGREFVIPKLGYFCNLCRVFYVNESDTRDVHCSSRTHYDNLQNHLQKLQNKPSRSSAQNSQGSISE
ncbi:uncharacterized protein LOC131455896 [Solea solea]|uniref:uncharacterized protein LOC131455896 n=1 Tax=Solea solea TaxID=90069 RepID=UPI00272B2927|nr:uncharacterized protein LOC131455896 [Solea solea]